MVSRLRHCIQPQLISSIQNTKFSTTPSIFHSKTEDATEAACNRAAKQAEIMKAKTPIGNCYNPIKLTIRNCKCTKFYLLMFR